MSDSDIDDAVASLPQQTLRRIDQAFERAISESRGEEKQRPRKRRRVEQPAPEPEPELAGGFLLDDDLSNNAIVADAGGGFVLEDDGKVDNKEETTSSPTHIPLSLIPRALQLLDLDPSDTQVLSVFQNAASSWSEDRPGGRRRPRRTRRLSDMDEDSDEDAEDSEPEQVVSRRDWRAVCAALIPSSNNNTTGSPLSSVEASDNDATSRPLPEEESDSGSSAVKSEEFEESDSSSDEYIPDSKRKGKSKGRGKGKARSRSQSAKSTPRKPRKSKGKTRDSTPDTTNLTSRQQQDTLSAFALFFPSQPKGTRSDLSEEELAKKRLTIKEIANAAASIKEKITIEEIVEMLTYISPSSTKSNPSMSFQEFQRMMIEARIA